MSTPMSPLEIELLWRRLVTTVDEAATTLVRTSFSSVIRDFHDYACAIFDPAGRPSVLHVGHPSRAPPLA